MKEEAHEASAWLEEALQDAGEVSRKKMFGGYGIFESGKMFALVTADGDIYLKATDANRAPFEEAGSTQFRRMPYWSLPEEALDDERLLGEWAARSIRVAHS